MLGHFTVCPTNVVYIGSLALCFRVAAASCRTRRPCALCAFPFPGVRSALYPAPSFPIPDPPFPLPFPSSFGDTTARTPALSSGPPLLSFISPSVARTRSAPCFRSYLHSMHRLCIPSPPHPLPVCCALPQFASTKSLWSLLFFFIPIPLAFRVEL